MTPTVSQISSQLRQIIFYHLDNDLNQNALFLAERLIGLEPRNPEAFHLAALCHLRLRQYRAAYSRSRLFGARGTHLGTAYVFAQACLALDRYTEGISALERSRSLWERRNQWNRHSESTRRHLPDAAAVHSLLGKLLHANGEMKRAVDSFEEALKLNPFMWDAFEHLCDTGFKINVSNVFKTNTEMLSMLSLGDNPSTLSEVHALPNNSTPQIQTAINIGLNPDPFNSFIKTDEVDVLSDSTKLFSNVSQGPSNVEVDRFESASTDTLPSRASQYDVPGVSANTLEPPDAPMRRTRTLQGLGMEGLHRTDAKLRPISTREKSESSDPFPLDLARSGATHKRTVSGSTSQASLHAQAEATAAQQQRKSERILNRIRPTSTKLGVNNASISKDRELKKVKATGTKGRLLGAQSTVGRVVSGNRKPLEGVEKSSKIRPLQVSGDADFGGLKASHNHERGIEALEWILGLLGSLGKGYFALSRYQCDEALHIFNSIASPQRDTPWVLAKIGRAQYEQTKYLEAEKTFAFLKRIAPWRLDDMEIYSTVLWHIKSDNELAFLSYELVDADRSSPQAWCTIGNSFSLQRDHDQAIKCFKRATQLDPKFAYGHTLQGHEHMSNEEYDKALLSYRKAIYAENRHYNGWYGLGKVYEKLGHLDMAEKHFKAAAEINPTNSVLLICIGVVQEKLRKPLVALSSYDKACKLAPSSALAHFRRARTLMALQRNSEALRELNLLKDMAPDEANVHFMLGKLHKNMRDKPNAVKHFTIALNLDPKAAPYIKDAMEAMDNDDDDDIEDNDEQML